VIGSIAVLIVIAAAAWQMPVFHRGASAASFPSLNASLEPLHSDFNRDIGHVRLIMLIDPT
jgi:hypothetical protein